MKSLIKTIFSMPFGSGSGNKVEPSDFDCKEIPDGYKHKAKKFSKKQKAKRKTK